MQTKLRKKSSEERQQFPLPGIYLEKVRQIKKISGSKALPPASIKGISSTDVIWTALKRITPRTEKIIITLNCNNGGVGKLTLQVKENSECSRSRNAKVDKREIAVRDYYHSLDAVRAYKFTGTIEFNMALNKGKIVNIEADWISKS